MPGCRAQIRCNSLYHGRFGVQRKGVTSMSTESSTTEFNRLPPVEQPAEQSSTKDVAKEQATGVASSASQAGQHVAGVAKDQAGNVAAEASRQVRDVVGQTRAELGQQAVQQQQRVAEGLHS